MIKIHGINGELLKGFFHFLHRKSLHFMPFYAIEKLKNLEFQENLFKFSCFLSRFRSPHLTLDIGSWSRDSPFVIRSRRAGLPYAIRNRKRGDSLSMYVSRMTRADNFLIRTFSKSKISKVFLETTFLHSSCHPYHYEPKIFYLVFRNSYVFNPNFEIPTVHLRPRYTILESRSPDSIFEVQTYPSIYDFGL